MFYSEPLSEPCVTKPARMPDLMLEEIVTCVPLCSLPKALLCPLPETRTHEDKASPDGFSVPGSTT